MVDLRLQIALLSIYENYHQWMKLYVEAEILIYLSSGCRQSLRLCRQFFCARFPRPLT